MRVGHWEWFGVTKTCVRIGAASLLWLTVTATHPASAQGNPEIGHSLAQRWCVSCHQVDPEDPVRGVSDTLQMLAKRNKYETRWLQAWQRDPHPHLEGVIFTRYQIEDIVAYLRSIPTE